MSDEKRNAKDEAGPEEGIKGHLTPDDDTEGHKARINLTPPTVPEGSGPSEAAKVRPLTEPTDDDTEGHRARWA